MTQPLALILHERLLPGSQLVNRLEDRGYRVKTIASPALLVETVLLEKPILAVVDMVYRSENASAAIAKLRDTPGTRHLPVIALVPPNSNQLEVEAKAAGATLIVQDHAILMHLQPLLDRALEVE